MVHRNKRFNKVKIFYERETDTLPIFTGRQTNSVARNVGHGVIVQYNRKTNLPVGAIVHDFERRSKDQAHAIEVPGLLPTFA